MWVRERDIFDYAGISAVTVLAWLHFPYRFYVYRQLHYWAGVFLQWIDQSPTQAVGAAVVVVALVGGTFLAGLVRSASA